MKQKPWETAAAIIVCMITAGCAGPGQEHITIGPSLATVAATGCVSPTNNIQTSATPPALTKERYVNEATTFTRGVMRLTPQAFAHVVIVPIWFSVDANCDGSFTSNELAQVAGDAGQETASIFAKDFAGSGYQVLNPVRVNCSEEDLADFDADTRQLLDQLRAEVWQLGKEISEANSALAFSPAYRYKFKSSLSPLLTKLGGTNAEALVLVDMAASLETPHHRHKRYAWNGTGGPLLTVAGNAGLMGIIAVGIAGGAGGVPHFSGINALMKTPNTVSQVITIVDLKTQDVLLWNSTVARGTDLRKPGQLNAAISDLLAGLPQITGKTSK